MKTYDVETINSEMTCGKMLRLVTKNQVEVWFRFPDGQIPALADRALRDVAAVLDGEAAELLAPSPVGTLHGYPAYGVTEVSRQWMGVDLAGGAEIPPPRPVPDRISFVGVRTADVVAAARRKGLSACAGTLLKTAPRDLHDYLNLPATATVVVTVTVPSKVPA